MIKRQRGRPFVGLALLVMVMFVLAACGGSISGGTPIVISNADLLRTAVANMKAAKSYHLEVNGKAPYAVQMGGDFDLAANNNKVGITIGGRTRDAVTIGNDVYLSSDGGESFTLDSSGAGETAPLTQFTGLWANVNTAEIDNARAKLKNGSPAQENIAGRDCTHMVANSADLPSFSTVTGKGIVGTVDIWVAMDGQSVCQMRLTGTSNGQQGDITLTWSKLGNSFDIKAPGK